MYAGGGRLESGVLVDDVVEDSKWQDADVRPNDFIVAVNGIHVDTAEQFQTIMDRHSGSRVVATLKGPRRGIGRTLKLHTGD